MRMVVTKSRRGFTLVEMLVVIGIGLVILGIIVIAAARAQRSANRSRTLADLQNIAGAMSIYVSDFGDVPRCYGYPGANGCDKWGDRGGPALEAALLAAEAQSFDGADGYGFRLNKGGQGKVYGPYLRSDTFKLTGNGTVVDNGYEMMDRFNHPILYYPAWNKRSIADIAAPGTYVDNYGRGVGNCSTPAAPKIKLVAGTQGKSLYDFGDNANGAGTPGDARVMYKMRAMLGDYDYDGGIGTATYPNGITIMEKPRYMGRYLLWSLGPDGQFGPIAWPVPPVPYMPADIDNCDDIIFSGDW